MARKARFAEYERVEFGGPPSLKEAIQKAAAAESVTVAEWTRRELVLVLISRGWITTRQARQSGLLK